MSIQSAHRALSIHIITFRFGDVRGRSRVLQIPGRVSRGKVLHPAPQHLFGTFSAFSMSTSNHFPTILSAFQHLALKFKGQSLSTKFYRKVLKKALKIVGKWLKVLGAALTPLEGILLLLSLTPRPHPLHPQDSEVEQKNMQKISCCSTKVLHAVC
jgi:hypothetical protein